MLRAALAALLSLAAFPAASDVVLQMPLACTLGDTCHIQHLPDHAPGPEIRDFLCGGLSYDGHDGTDFALPSLAAMRAGVDVLAAAAGQVVGIRDGMDDVLYDPESAAIDGRECGNGVVIRHADGWETQYCHMKQGSVAVRSGDMVGAGDRLGQVGLSGQTQFPHLHLAVRHDGRSVDPFAPEAPDACQPDAPWSPDRRAALSADDLWARTPPLSPGGLIQVGFAPALPEYDAIKDGRAAHATLPDDAPAVVIYGFAYGSQPGDVLRLDITGPDGKPFHTREVELTRAQAQLFRASGRRLTAPAWPRGTYDGRVTLLRDGLPLATMATQLRID